eukprot:CAMPEP_0183328050 /NCGR_PEP_ID=MMETSP0160_2-20130417/84082_1 /TAXON_ID=2839 ORGANISM="Odontella Sinensis, Strain Grunow 1884" /NCGR_SAMPLE_ID=MMETSP0160_2 /ASSEMBLY_ACC=CAM_ASM_000250 /LENGTH=78 /DNA_ID=CAMNT_0025496203 /DNA_START=476 /DNA_END=712 /DNA_ORIENTATION=+
MHPISKENALLLCSGKQFVFSHGWKSGLMVAMVAHRSWGGSFKDKKSCQENQAVTAAHEVSVTAAPILYHAIISFQMD